MDPERELTGLEKKFLALALQGLMLRQKGPETFHLGISIATKLGIKEHLEEIASEWIEYRKQTEEPNDPKTD